MYYIKSFFVALVLHLIVFGFFKFVKYDREIYISTPLTNIQFEIYSTTKKKKKIASKKSITKVQKENKKITEIRKDKTKGEKKKIEKKKTSKENSKKIFEENELDYQEIIPFGNRIPNYPAVAKRYKIEGFVRLKLLINKEGKVKDIKVIEYKGHAEFITESLKVANKWRFPPLTSKGKRVMAWVTQKIQFNIK